MPRWVRLSVLVRDRTFIIIVIGLLVFAGSILIYEYPVKTYLSNQELTTTFNQEINSLTETHLYYMNDVTIGVSYKGALDSAYKMGETPKQVTFSSFMSILGKGSIIYYNSKELSMWIDWTDRTTGVMYFIYFIQQ